ncbi:MAG: hypothetical protein E6J42_04465 [Chloroflexi bacterium]|nr:MAG: hypothetical protein E6J42_04465 [Chloroflexota bacterium]
MQSFAPGQAAVAERPAGVPAMPPAPASLEETGLSPSFLLELVLKVIHYADTPTPDHVGRVVGLPVKLVEALLESLKADRLCEIVGGGSTYDLSTSYRFRLTERGEQRAEQALERCRYAGAAPVTIGQYQKVIGSQSKDRRRPAPEAIAKAFNSLVVDEAAAGLLSRALSSGRCAMVFGPSGNGKTSLLSQFIANLEGEVLIPYALYAYGQIIRTFDATVHVRIDSTDVAGPPSDSGAAFKRVGPRDESTDRRWVRIRRPGLVVGGELTAESLELGYDPIAKFYQAPKHVKAQGGFLLVDDFGRQKVSPAELLNRWIMALERGSDYLVLRTGEAIEFPFDVTLLFSTNLNPTDLADSAFLRRILYKVRMPATGPKEFKQVLRQVCAEQALEFADADLDRVVRLLTQTRNHPLSGALARDLVSIIRDNAEHDNGNPALSVAAIELAYLQFTGIAAQPADGKEGIDQTREVEP